MHKSTSIGNFFCSWSGGKDCCLALYKAIQAGGIPKLLMTTCIEEGERTRIHGLHIDVIQAQANALGIPSITQNTSWENYKIHYTDKMKQFNYLNLNSGVFGDIDFAISRAWQEGLCQELGLQTVLPLWQRPREELVHEFLALGFSAYIVAVNSAVLDKAFLGKQLSLDLISEFKSLGIDPSGEGGEYHSVVVNGPIFKQPVHLTPGIQVLRSNYWYQDYSVLT